MQYRRLRANEVDEALALAERVFMADNARNYPLSMVTFFVEQLIRNEKFAQDYKDGTCMIYGAVSDNPATRGEIVGVLTLNLDKKKVNLLFIDGEHQRKGIGTELLQALLDENHDIEELYVNCPEGGVKDFLLDFGFEPFADTVSSAGVSFTPLRYGNI